MASVTFCPCVDYECSANPVNHDQGCTPCVQNCLQDRDIPVCFFRALEPDMEREQDYSYRGFAAFIEGRMGNNSSN